MISLIKRKITSYLSKKYQEDSQADHSLKVNQLDKSLEICQKYFFNEIEFEFKDMIIRVKQDGMKVKTVNMLLDKIKEAKVTPKEELETLVNMTRGE